MVWKNVIVFCTLCYFLESFGQVSFFLLKLNLLLLSLPSEYYGAYLPFSVLYFVYIIEYRGRTTTWPFTALPAVCTKRAWSYTVLVRRNIRATT